MTDLLTFEDALAVLDEMHLVVDDPGLLAAAIGRPGATVFAEDAYPHLAGKVAALLESTVRNHALQDGNEQAGWAFAVITLWLNGCDITYDEDEAFTAIMKVAGGGARLSTIYEWFADMTMNAGLQDN